ncbi:hypothetical protein MHBO_004521, partial [Bonamia ostreae]
KILPKNLLLKLTAYEKQYGSININFKKNLQMVQKSINECKASIESVKTLKSEKLKDIINLKMDVCLSNGIYSKASVDLNGVVCLKINEDVLVEYEYEEAILVLEDSLLKYKEKRRMIKKNLGVLMSQMALNRSNLQLLDKFLEKNPISDLE